jgi:hypothetical protein
MEYLIVILILIFCFFIMNIGLIFKNRPLKKGCGSSPDGCEICGGDISNCDS